uniref:KIAA1755 n=1 Tax=Dromaius novaehollandiae TaxID=8790 RepID=A0A8C4JAR2_DRONO
MLDARSLDAAVQSALRALYPPFEATAPTVLGQVFRLLETSYRGDGLCCLLEFLIPAKRLFEHVRQAACAPYFNCVFLHEGWPLCLREKVVVHLAPLNPLLLRSGDFYLQAEPCGERAARLTVKHLSRDLRTVRETPVPEATYALLFTNEWLEEINCEHDGAPLHSCLVATEDGIAPLPWSRIATPEFVDKPDAGPGCARAGASSPTGVSPPVEASSPKSGPGKYPGLIKVDQLGPWKKPAALAVPSLREIVSRNLEGEYVDLLEPSREQRGLLARALPDAGKQGGLRLLKSPARSEAAGSGHRFSFLKGQRHGASPGDGAGGDRAAGHHEGPWKKMSAIYSPRMSRAKPAGKGNGALQTPVFLHFSALFHFASSSLSHLLVAGLDPAAGGPTEDRSLQEPRRAEPGATRPAPGRAAVGCPGGSRCRSAASPSSAGSTDKLGRALLQVTTSGSAWEAAWCSAGELARLVLYLLGCSRGAGCSRGVGCSRAQGCSRAPAPAAGLPPARSRLLPFGAAGLTPGLLSVAVAVGLPQSPRAVQHAATLRPLSPKPGRGRSRGGGAPGLPERGVRRRCPPQEVAARVARPQELMRRVLSDPQLLGLQRDGGALLARLRREAARLGASPHVRYLEAAEGLYEQLEEDVHGLVSQSNRCLERLELLRRTRQLEAEFGEARYHRGLALCQEAAEVQDSAFPEAEPFQAAAALFRTKLASFHAAAERRRAELAALQELRGFSSKVGARPLLRRAPGELQAEPTKARGEPRAEPNPSSGRVFQVAWLRLAGTGCSARGQSQPGNLEALRGLESSLQRLSVDFSLEKLQEMQAHVRTMRSSGGPAAWAAARQRYREARQVLEEMLAELRQAWGADTPGEAAPAPGAAREPPAGSTTGSPRESRESQEGEAARRSRTPAGGSLPKSNRGASPAPGGSLSRPVRGCPCAPPAQTRCADRPRPTAPGEPPAEAAQYFQVSSRSSLSSDDSDSPASAEEAPAPPCPSAKPPRVLYLEKHRADGPAAAGAE